MNRVRKLYQRTCSEMIRHRDEALSGVNEQYHSFESFNRLVDQLEKDHGIDWCNQRAIVKFPAGFKFTVVMPVFNESKTIEAMIDRVCKVNLPLELIVVDDGSADGTREVLERLQGQSLSRSNRFGDIEIRILFHSENRGKGAALKTGFQAASGDVVAIQDADQEYDPQEFIALVSTILLDESDIVYGSRFAEGSQSNSPGWHRFGNGIITWLSNRMTGLGVTDAETCYKLIRKSILDQLIDDLQENRFGIELEMTAKLAKIAGTRFDERPISYHKRTYEEGKKIGVRDGFRALWCILKY